MYSINNKVVPFSTLVMQLCFSLLSYCMRERLNEVPEGDWLCEECKFAEEAEKQKQGKAEYITEHAICEKIDGKN